MGVIYMIFENRSAAFRFISAVYISDRATKTHISNRSFCALSFRINSETEISSGKQKLKLNTGDIAFFPVNTPYSRVSKKDELIAIHFELFNDATRDICVYTPRDPQLFYSLFREALSICEKKEAGYIYAANAVLNTIFMHILSERQTLETHSEKFTAAKQYMSENYTNPQLTISDIANHCGVSEGYLRRLFNKEAGVSPKRFLNALRIQHASSLVNCGFYSIAQISEMVGFYDPKYFSTVYKKYTAATPRTYRENDRNVERLFSRAGENRQS